MISTAKLYAVLILLAIAALGEGLLLWHVYRAGENKVDRQDLKRVQQHDQQTARQAAKDKQDDTDTIAKLRSQLSDALLPLPTAAVRVCVADSGDQGRPAVKAASGAQPGESARPADDQRVLPGDQPGPDVSADLRALADAGVILATYRQSLVDWAERQSQPLKETLQ